MKKSLPQKLIQNIRKSTPLSIRQKIGPILARFYYLDRLSFKLLHNKIPKVLSIEETIDKIISEKLSVIRFGDGEISLIDGLDLAFQKRSDELSNKLEEIIKSDNEKLLTCIPGIWGKLDHIVDYAYDFNMHHIYRYYHVWENLLSYKKNYGDTNVTRHYLGYKDKSKAGEIFKKIFSLWENQDIVLIEGEKSRLGVGNDMFDNVKSLKRILCPPENAYSKYKVIEKEALKIDKNTLILLSLGPTAKIIAYDLFLLGYRVIDIGHIDMEYEMFLRKETKQVKVPHKYFNEINERNPIECNDKKYLEEILVTIK
ncbi:MAG: SP_1767 family glycosyltransferase [Candidatus Pacebacteria bacterium]|nr:SP_1767 family glycosyltransferase [Candidatus Paceibacterota bacterium]